MDEQSDLNGIDASDFHIPKAREKCGRCERPVSVCICYSLPKVPYELKHSKLILLQHPGEKKRPLNTSAIIEACLTPKSYSVYKGRQFNCNQKFEDLHDIVGKSQNTFILYPSNDAISLEEMVEMGDRDTCYNIVLIDGTWRQARSMYAQTKFVKNLPKVKISSSALSEYLIRQQPTDQCLCTVECAAISLSVTEKNPLIQEMMLKPLRTLCEIQLKNGAVVKKSKEGSKF